MRVVASDRRRPTQRSALRAVSFGLIHRKAVFEYPRTEKLRGDEQRRIVAIFHRSLGQTAALVAEYREFIREFCSILCTSHIATELLEEPEFDQAFRDYERRFAEYFCLFCAASRAGVDATDPSHALLPLLTHELNAQRRLIVAGKKALAAAQATRNALLRPTGDTVRLPVLR